MTQLIEEKGLQSDGLYRVSGNLSSIQKIRCSVDAGSYPSLKHTIFYVLITDKYGPLLNETDVHVLSGTLKMFFRELSESLFPPSSTKEFLSAAKLSGKARLIKFDSLIKELPQENRETLKHLLKHLER